MAGTREKTEKSGGPAKGGIQSLERAAAIIDVVDAGGEHGASLTDMAEATGLHNSTIFHLVKTLDQLGYLARLDEGKQYFVGPRIFSLAAGAPQMRLLALTGQPVLEELSAMTGEAAHLAVRTGSRVIVVARADAPGMIQISYGKGQTRPIHATAIGKMLLSRCSPEDRDAIVKSISYEAYTPYTIRDAAALRTEIERVCELGFAEDRCEFDENVRCLAIIVPGLSSRLNVSIGISGPVWRMTDDAVAAHLPILHKQADVLSRRLGGLVTS
ncbi:IclR family transcriptional regulator [Pseudohoeflea coraliihabitans]|uniref:IclR family transcriptional regulator n=1 Tax=Pseudohoeflea coraliihabitans TaxID=2860393 RepID=A0ABS6WNJ5_9HYPH|nr:IclR family transcriptional regulator [Pseudohoeflea sp. DP4N28-3]MBW3097233.1 IclR family transcriptional regulator [Pseudohoeflea sp. DP4N28-3]